MGRLRAFLPLILALVTTAVAIFFLYNWMQTKTTGGPQTKIIDAETVNTAVAAVDLEWGVRLKPEMIKLAPYIKESVPPGTFQDPEALVDRVVVQTIMKNEPVLESRLAPINVETGGVAAVVSPGKRALAVKGDNVLGMAGLIRPGSRVDVLATITNPAAEDDALKDITKVVLENIKVLATGKEMQKDKDGGSLPADVYTLEVTPEEAEKLALASTKGRLHFALRNATDNKPVYTEGTTIPIMLAGAYYPTAAPPPPEPEVVEQEPPPRLNDGNLTGQLEVERPEPEKPEKEIPPPPPMPKPRRIVTVVTIRGADVGKVEFTKEY